jgi:hypothetical protein
MGIVRVGRECTVEYVEYVEYVGGQLDGPRLRDVAQK